MNPFVVYIINVSLCSGMLFGYYWLALRNKTFHQWNRVYLLVCVVFSIAAPLIKINIGSDYAAPSNQMFKMLRVVAADGEAEVQSHISTGFALTTELCLLLLYSAISLILFAVITFNCIRIYIILRSYPKTKLDRIFFLNTTEKGTPFSVFQYIVWNRAIDMKSENGQRIFQHEVVHVQQRHTWDKVFLLVTLIPFWINPFFWLIRKELTALHEFTADQKAVSANDTMALAQMILNTTFPQQQFLFTNHLFQSTIKRRIAMYAKLQNPKVNYLSRIVALPVLLLVLGAFVLKTKPISITAFNTMLDKPITVVIDAGHGALEDGARQNDVYESDLVLAIAKKIRAQNANKNIRIVLTRETNETIGLKRRVEIASENKADLFISVHTNAAPLANEKMYNQQDQPSGIEVVVSAKNPPYQQQSELFGSALVQTLQTVYATQTDLIKKETGIWVIDHNICPAVLIECGYLTNKKDLAFITKDENQIQIANKILSAIEQYGVLKNNNKANILADTLPAQLYKNKPVTDVQYFEWPKKEVVVFLADGTKERISVAEAFQANLFDSSAKSRIERRPWASQKVAEPNVITGDFVVRKASLFEAQKFKGLVLFNNEIFDGTFQQLQIRETDIAYISIIKGNAFDKFQLKPGDSVLSISTKAFMQATQRTDGSPDNEPLYTQPEVGPRFPGSKDAWLLFLRKNLNAGVPIVKGAKPGTFKVVVGFIVDGDGKLHDIKPVTHFGFGMEEEVVRLMKASPDWIPAVQNGRNVTAYKKQTVTFVIAEG